MAQNADRLPVLLARREAFLGFLAARLTDNRSDAEDGASLASSPPFAPIPPSLAPSSGDPKPGS